MLGLELPRRADPLLFESQTPAPKTSSDRIAEVIERMCLEGPVPEKREPEN
jgi:hypothetical protein